LGVFNEENLFACGRDFRLGSFATVRSAPVCGAAGGNDLEFIVARQLLVRSNNNAKARGGRTACRYVIVNGVRVRRCV
jgi:hypothetical protein